MPKVSGTKKKQTYSRRKTSGSRQKKPDGFLTQAGAALDDFLQRAIRVLVTYTAVCVTGCVIVFVMMLFAGGYFFNVGARIANLSKEVSKGAGFEVTRVTLKGGQKTRNHDILNALYDKEDGQPIGRSLPHFDLEDARRRVEDIGWVNHAAVARLWPNTIHISVSERTPAALWQPTGAGELFLIDNEGAVITEVGGHQYTGLPLIINTDDPEKAKGVLRELSRFPELASRIAALRQQGNRRWDLVFRNDFLVMLPEKDYRAVIEKLVSLEAEESGLSESLKYMDVRDTKTVYYRPKKQN